MAAFVWAAAVAGNWSVGANWQVGGTPQIAPPTTSDTVTFGAGTGFTQSNCTLDVTGNVSTIIFTGYTGGFTYSGQTLNVSGATCTFATGMTLTGDASSAIICAGSTTLQPANKSFPGLVSFTGATATIGATSGTGAFTNLSRAGTINVTSSFTISQNHTVSGTLTLAGNSVQGTARQLVTSNVLGTQRVFSMSGGAVVINGDVDFKDIDITGSPSWTNASSSFVGDVNGNGSLITTNRTTPATQTSTGTASFSWASHGWTTRVPLPQDNVIINNAFIAGRTITVNMPRLGNNIDVSGATGAPAFNWNLNTESYGNVAMASNVVPSGGTNTWTFSGRGAQTITNNGMTWADATRITTSAVTGSYTLQDAFVAAPSVSPSFLTVTTGTFADGGFNITTGQFAVSGTATYTAGNITFTANGTSTGNMINITSANANMTNMTVSIPTRTVSQTFSGGGKTYKALNIVGGTGVLTVAGANTFTNLPQITGGTQSIVWPGSTTTTFTNGGNFGNSTNVLTFTASAGSATLSFGTQVNADYLNLTNIPAAGTTPAYAGTHSTDGGGNTNWSFTAAPTTVSSSNMLLMGV